jgi:hypothetical protein
MSIKDKKEIKHWKIELKNKDEEIVIQAGGYSKKKIREIFNETHPEWDIKTIKKFDLSKKVGDKNG